MIGYLSDRYAEYRFLQMLSAAIVLIIGFVFLFMPLTKHYLLWFGIGVLASTTAFSVLSINLAALGALWSKDQQQKTRIVAYREGFGLAGLILAVSLPSLGQQFLPKQQSFLYLGLLLAMLMLLALFCMHLWLRNNLLAANAQSRINAPIKSTASLLLLRSLLRLSLPTKMLMLTYGVSMLAASIPAVLIVFFVRDYLVLEAYLGLFLLTYFLAAALAMPL